MAVWCEGKEGDDFDSSYELVVSIVGEKEGPRSTVWGKWIRGAKSKAQLGCASSERQGCTRLWTTGLDLQREGWAAAGLSGDGACLWI